MRCGAAAGADAYYPEPELEPEPLEHFARSWSRSRQKRGGSGSKRDVKLSKISKREMKAISFHYYYYYYYYFIQPSIKPRNM